MAQKNKKNTLFLVLGFTDIALGILFVLFGASVLGIDQQIATIIGVLLVIMGIGPIVITQLVGRR